MEFKLNWGWLSNKKKTPPQQSKPNVIKSIEGSIPPGRVSVPNDAEMDVLTSIRGMTSMVTPSFRTDLIPLIRDLYKVNPDMSIAVQDIFKLANTGHTITFPNNSDEESAAMLLHLDVAARRWSNYTAGIDGLVNKFMVQCLIGGAISIEAVPDLKLKGVSTVLFINPEDVIFQRKSDGVYHPYQMNRSSRMFKGIMQPYIKLNMTTFKYNAMFNDTDEPYGIPPFLAALDSLKTQADMRTNLKQIMELMGLLGFLEVTMEKPDRQANESIAAYERRLNRRLTELKKNVHSGMKDGVVVGYQDDHTFKLNSTTKNLGGIDKVWSLNQQSVANGLGTSGTIIGVQSSNTEGGAGIVLSKMISQLKNIQMLASNTLEFIYTLELRLAGFNNKGMKITFNSSTVSDELKIHQANEYKIRNLISEYNQGLISQDDFARAMGILKPDQKKPRPPQVVPGAGGGLGGGVSSPAASAKKKKRETDKDTSDRKTRDKNKTVPKRKDQKDK